MSRKFDRMVNLQITNCVQRDVFHQNILGFMNYIFSGLNLPKVYTFSDLKWGGEVNKSGQKNIVFILKKEKLIETNKFFSLRLKNFTYPSFPPYSASFSATSLCPCNANAWAAKLFR